MLNLIFQFQDTIHQIEESKYLSHSLKNSIEGTRVYETYVEAERSGWHSHLPEANSMSSAVVTVSPNTTFDAGRELVEELGEEKRVAVLNFANAFHPGGGVRGGATAQEEGLCRCSTLYPCITAVQRTGAYYDKNVEQLRKNPKILDQEGIIYSPDITVIKEDNLNSLAQCVNMDVITSAAPEAFRFPSSVLKKLPDIFREKIRAILKIAILNECDGLVLGAFGCGAFRNPPEMVAKCFKEVLEEEIEKGIRYKDCFEKIVFAIRNSSRQENSNYTIFDKVLGGNANGEGCL